MTTIIIVAIIAAVAYYIYYLSHGNHKDEEEDKWYTEQPSLQSSVIENPKIIIGGGESDAPVQKLQYFCIKDKGYHVSVWPKDHYQPDIIEFDIAGMSYRENIDDYFGEFKGTLEAEPTNTYDPNAIKILAPDGHHVGYVPKDMTADVRKYATLPCTCYFYIGENDGIYFSDCYIILN